MKGLTFATYERERKSGVAVNGAPTPFVKTSPGKEGNPHGTLTECCIHHWRLPYMPENEKSCKGSCEKCGLTAIFGDGPRRYICQVCGSERESIVSTEVNGTWQHVCDHCVEKRLNGNNGHKNSKQLPRTGVVKQAGQLSGDIRNPEEEHTISPEVANGQLRRLLDG